MNSTTLQLDPNPNNYSAWDPLVFLPSPKKRRQVPASLDEIYNLCANRDAILEKFDIPVTSYPLCDADGMEVGDDRADFSRSPLNLAMSISAQEKVLDMKTSWEDTYISNEMWNFTEVSNSVPCMPEGSFHHARKVGEFKNLEYTDTVILRLIVDCSKGDASHSSTAVGKAGMLGSRVNTPRSEHRSDLHLASYLQDASLRTAYSPDPKYLPSIMGGSGVRALFDNPTNLYLSVKAYRGGGYDRLYGSATEEARQCLWQLDRGTGATPVLCQRLRDRQEYLHGTYADKILIPSQASMKRGVVPLPEPLYGSVGSQNRFQNVETRLVRTKALIGRRDAERELEKTLKTRDALMGTVSSMHAFGQWKQARAIARRKFDMALQGNTAFGRLLARCANGTEVETLIREGFLSVGCGVREFSKWDAHWLFSGGKSETFTIENLTISEDMFLRDEVSTEESFKVGGIPLQFFTHGKTRVEKTSCRVGLYQINEGMLEWSDKMVARLREERAMVNKPLVPSDLLRVFSEDLEWVNDDTLLIEKCLRDTASMTNAYGVILVSDDRRLANQMANTANVTVYRVSPHCVIKVLKRNEWTSGTAITVSEIWPYINKTNVNDKSKRPWNVYVDTGSLSSACAGYQLGDDQLGDEETLYIRKLIDYGRNNDDARYCRYSLHKVTRPAVMRAETFRSLARTKRFRWPNSLETVYHSEMSAGSSSWQSEGRFSRRTSSTRSWV